MGLAQVEKKPYSVRALFLLFGVFIEVRLSGGSDCTCGKAIKRRTRRVLKWISGEPLLLPLSVLFEL